MKRLLPAWVKWPQLDLPLLAGLFLLMGLGLVVLYSASGGDIGVVQRQAVRLGVGLVALLVLSQVPPHILRIWTPWLYGFGVLLLLATWFFGTGRATNRWLDLGLLRFQPSEIMKLGVPMMVAWYLHPRRLLDGVIEGVRDGGNKSGIPTTFGQVIFDAGYLGKCLVFVTAVGIMPARINGEPAEQKRTSPGECVIMCGGRVGKDGIHGVTAASETFSESTPAGHVQIGDPYTQKKMHDFLLEA